VTTFVRDLDAGKSIEGMVLDLIKPKYPAATIINGYFPGYDIWIPEIHKSVEVKSDKKSQETGNIVIEVEMFEKPSALFSTKADYWVFFDGFNFLWTTPKRIFECVILNKLRLAEFIGKGDSDFKKAFLVNKNLFNQYILSKGKFNE
jgi:hypothetical protein|tara:strand:- start:30 stop:470 length:441 start_codon:yes stop_codon:yes gene_type:complete